MLHQTQSAQEEEERLMQELQSALDAEAAAAAQDEALQRTTLAERAAREAAAERLRREHAEQLLEEEKRLEAVAARRAELTRAKITIQRKLLRRQGNTDQLVPLFLREMPEDEVFDFVDACVDYLVKKHKKRYEAAAKVFGGSARRLVEDIVLSLSRNRVDRHGKIQVMFKLFVNGDPQRGKSNVEAVMARIVHFINNSPLVKDKCYSLLGSVMIGWAESLFASTRELSTDLAEFKKEAREKEGRRAAGGADGEGGEDDDASDSDDEPAEDDVEDANAGEGAADGVSAGLQAELVLGKKGTLEEDQKHVDVAKSGGVLVFPRNMRALIRVNALVGACPHYGYCGCCLHALNACAIHSASRRARVARGSNAAGGRSCRARALCVPGRS